MQPVSSSRRLVNNSIARRRPDHDLPTPAVETRPSPSRISPIFREVETSQRRLAIAASAQPSPSLHADLTYTVTRENMRRDQTTCQGLTVAVTR